MSEKVHEIGRDCWCKPKVTETAGTVTVQHNKEAKGK